MHELIFNEETETDVFFRCVQCGEIIGFNKPDIGKPCAVSVDKDEWQPAKNPDQWMGLCTTVQCPQCGGIGKIAKVEEIGVII
jgi:predicted RNA-binding Zn-ribbon protein involved in translation (DUF1610 family)